MFFTLVFLIVNLLYLYIINEPTSLNSLFVNESETLVYTVVVQDIPYLDSTGNIKNIVYWSWSVTHLIETPNDMTSLIKKQNISQLSAVNLTVTLSFPSLAF